MATGHGHTARAINLHANRAESLYPTRVTLISAVLLSLRIPAYELRRTESRVRNTAPGTRNANPDPVLTPRLTHPQTHT